MVQWQSEVYFYCLIETSEIPRPGYRDIAPIMVGAPKSSPKPTVRPTRVGLPHVPYVQYYARCEPSRSGIALTSTTDRSGKFVTRLSFVHLIPPDYYILQSHKLTRCRSNNSITTWPERTTEVRPALAVPLRNLRQSKHQQRA